MVRDDNSSEIIFGFGDFMVDSGKRVLSCNGEPIPLTPRVFDTLLAFLHRPGETLTKEELLTRIWHGKFVEESNLVQNVAVLRKALRDGEHDRRFIATIPRRGYRFVSDVHLFEEAEIPSDVIKKTGTEPDGMPATGQSHPLSAMTQLIARSTGAGFPILFCGFYEESETNGFLTRSRLSRLLEKEFFGVFETSFLGHGIQNYHSIRVLNVKTPAMIHHWCDRDRFDRFLSRYGRKALGVVWGTVNRNGIKTLRANLNSGLNARNPMAEEQINRLVGVLNRFKVFPEQRARYLGTVWAALWCQSFCNDIAFRGDWQAAHRLAAESRRMIENAAYKVSPNPSQKRALALLTKCYCQTHAFQ